MTLKRTLRLSLKFIYFFSTFILITFLYSLIIFLKEDNREVLGISDVLPSDHIVFDEQPSPNGSYIAFAEAKNIGMDGSKIWLMDKYGEEFYLISSNAGSSYSSTPTWSPDGTKLAYFKFYPYQIGVFDLETKTSKAVYYDDGSETDMPNLFASISYGGHTYLKWLNNSEIEFEDNLSIPNRKYAINIRTEKTRLTEEVKGTKLTQNLKVPFFSQKDLEWKDEQLGTCSETLGSAGCAVTAVSMVLKYFEIENDPKRLNEMLSLHNNLGYANGCEIIWYAPINYAEGVRMKGVYGQYNTKRLDYELGLGNLVVVGFDNVNFSDIPHWIVVKGKNAKGEYLTNDPWTGEEKTLNYFGERFDRMVVYAKD